MHDSAPWSAIEPIVRSYPSDCSPRQCESLGRLGLSGAEFWRLATSRGPMCLRAWPAEHPNAHRLGWIHALLAGLTAAEPALPLALPVAARSGETFLAHGGRLWQLEPWLPGTRLSQLPGDEGRSRTSVRAVARWHRAAGTLRDLHTPQAGPCLAARERLDQLDHLLSGGYDALRKAVDQVSIPWADELAQRWFHRFHGSARTARAALEEASRMVEPRLPCWRDAHPDNFLFVEDALTGMLDFGSARVGSPAADAARLIGALAGDDRATWDLLLDEYASVRPGDEAARRLMWLLHTSAPLLVGATWLRWLYQERRQFDSPHEVAGRIRVTLERMEHPIR